jgi:hypothetical protein
MEQTLTLVSKDLIGTKDVLIDSIQLLIFLFTYSE